MKKFTRMSRKALDAYQPTGAAEFDAHYAETRYRDWCRERELDYADPDVRAQYRQEQDELMGKNLTTEEAATQQTLYRKAVEE